MDRVSRNGYSALVNGERIRLSHAYGPRYEKLGYEPTVHRVLDEVVGERMVVLDIGAHVGIHALLVARRVGPGGRVFAFEPAPQTADLLERHIRWNGLEGRVEAVRAVVSDAVGVTAFFVNGATMAASVHEGNLATAREAFAGPTERILCETTTVDAFSADRGIRVDVIKLDVEGAEVAVLRGATSTLRSGVTVVCEVHPQQLEVLGSSVEELEGLVSSAGLAMRTFDEPNELGIFHVLIEPVASAVRPVQPAPFTGSTVGSEGGRPSAGA
jgi:FkbM family methyltransferase